MPDASSDPSSLVVVAITNAFALASAVFIAASISGGHVNPAVTFGMAVGGHISVPTALFYWISQMLASIIACVVLKVTIVGQVYKNMYHCYNNYYLVLMCLFTLSLMLITLLNLCSQF